MIVAVQQRGSGMLVSYLTRLMARIPLNLGSAVGKTGKRHANIAKTINDALAAAGLTGKSSESIAPRESPTRQRVPMTRSESRPEPRPLPGSFREHAFAHAVGQRRYKLYVPSGYSPQASHPLLVLLHGCTQSPDDFAAGTRMNELAEQHGFLVVYPAQSTSANGSKCWNWFRPADQRRQGGEPELLAALTTSIVGKYSIDPDQVYVAGLSAGAAMAVTLGATHPDVFAAVGAHSGLPFRAAHDVPSAFAAMGGQAANSAAAPSVSTGPAGLTIPLIVFHGDSDKTVAASNADALVRQTIPAGIGHQAGNVSEGTKGGRRYTRTVYPSPSGQALMEFWKIHGAGHAWSGGSSSGTFTDTRGPDASAEMVRFFMQVRRSATR